MIDLRIVSVNIARNNAIGPELYRIDYGTKLRLVGTELPVAYEVHFGKNKKDDAILQIGDSTGVIVPDELLLTDGTLYGWLYVHTGADDGWTKREFTCPVKNRPGVSPDEPIPVQQGVIDQAIAALNSAVDQTNADVETTGEAVTAAQAAQEAAEIAAGQAGTSATSAAQSAEQAAQSAASAGVYASDAIGSAQSAASSADSAAQSATDAEDSAVNAAGSAVVAGQSASSAAQSAEAAQDAVENVQSAIDTALAAAKASGEFDGADGFSPIASVEQTATGATVTVTDKIGTTTANLTNGVGVPAGGSAGQVLSKASGTDYDTEWTTPEAGGVQDVQVNGVSVLSDGVANVPLANNNTIGVVQLSNLYGIRLLNGRLATKLADTNTLKRGTDQYDSVVAQNQDASTFYGLAKAAGSDEKNSTLPLGQYTESAKSAISQMLSGSVTVTGSTPSITAMPGIRYVCGEVTTLDITLPANGIVDVVFTSGSTPAVLNAAPAGGQASDVKWANGWDGVCEANTTYEINVMDGVYGVVGQWS